MLRYDLRRLSSELPTSISAAIEQADVEFALETLARHPCLSASRAAHQAAAGIAWERTVVRRVQKLAEYDKQVVLHAERWQPAGRKLDLDLILHDHHKAITWILDAKLAKPHERHVRSMRNQIALLKREQLAGGYPMIMGIIVHHRNQLHVPLESTDHPRILRSTLQRVGDLLLAKRPPGERPNLELRRAA